VSIIFIIIECVCVIWWLVDKNRQGPFSRKKLFFERNFPWIAAIVLFILDNAEHIPVIIRIIFSLLCFIYLIIYTRQTKTKAD